MKIIITLCLFLSVSTFLLAQNTSLPKTEVETRNLICHEWKFSKVVMDGKTIKMDPYREMYWIFNDSGKFTMVQDGKHDDLKWLLGFKSKELMIYGEKKELLAMMGEKVVLSSIDAKLLVLAFYEKNQLMGKMYFTKVR